MSTDYAKAGRLLARRDPILRDLIRAHGPCGLADARHTDPFRALVSAVISQQLSTKAAATIKAGLETVAVSTAGCASARDLGILKAVQRVYGMRKAPSPERLTKLGEQWRPYRSVACWYLWASLDDTPQ